MTDIIDPYIDSIVRTEPACAMYLLKHYFIVETQPSETRSARLAYGWYTKYKIPDLDVFYKGRNIQIEVKAYDEYTPYPIYSSLGKGGLIKNLKGWDRFNKLKELGFEQGLDKYEVDRLLKWQQCKYWIPILVAFNDFHLRTWDNGNGLWYGTRLGEFIQNGRKATYQGKTQYFLRIALMKPIEQVIKDAVSLTNIAMHLPQL